MSGLNPDVAASKFTEVLPESPGGRWTKTLSRGLDLAVPGIQVHAQARQLRALLADPPRPPSRKKPALCIFLVKLFLKETAGLRSQQPHQAAGHHEPCWGGGGWTAGPLVAIPGTPGAVTWMRPPHPEPWWRRSAPTQGLGLPALHAHVGQVLDWRWAGPALSPLWAGRCGGTGLRRETPWRTCGEAADETLADSEDPSGRKEPLRRAGQPS